MAARLDFAGAPQDHRVDAHAIERRHAVNDDMMVEQGLVFRGKRVERSAELVRRHRAAAWRDVAAPRFRQGAERVEVVGDRGDVQRPRVVRCSLVDERHEAVVEHAAGGLRPCARSHGGRRIDGMDIRSIDQRSHEHCRRAPNPADRISPCVCERCGSAASAAEPAFPVSSAASSAFPGSISTPSSPCSTAAGRRGSCATSWACCRRATSSSAR